MKPLGLSVWQLTTPRPMVEAGGRLFVDVTQILASPASRAGLLGALGKSDPLIRDALETVLDRGDFIPSLPNEGPGMGAAWWRVRRDRNRSGHRRRADRTQPGLARRLEARHPDEVRIGAARLHPGAHPGAEADPVRSAKHAGDHGGDGGHLVAQRPAAGVAGREERGRHAHAIRPQQRHVGDGAGAAGRRGRDPPASGRGGFSAARRGRGIPGRAAQARGRAGSSRRHPGLARQVRHARRRRDRHHEAALERTSHHARAPSSSATSRTSSRAPASGASSKDGRRPGRRNRSCCSACALCRTGSRRPKRPSA